MNKNIVLCGFMGSGKTVTGKSLAEALNMEFIDLDKFIEQNEGMTVSEIFEKFGEPHFRKLETEASVFLGKSNGKVIACGGGTVMRSENVSALKAGGDIYYLSVTAETVKIRLKDDNTRPLLAKDKNGTIDRLLSEREPKYKAASDHIIDSNGTVDYAVSQITEIYKKQG